MDNMFTIDDFFGPGAGKGAKGESGKKIDLAKAFGYDEDCWARNSDRRDWYAGEFKDAYDDLFDLYEYEDEDYEDISWHRGALAGLTPEERENAIAERLTMGEGCSYLLELLDAASLKGAPVTNFTELLNVYGEDDLRDFASALGIDDTDDLDKQALVERISDLRGNTSGVMNLLLNCAPVQFDTLMTLVERDAPVRFDAGSVREYKDFVALPPYTNVFKQGPIYTLSVTDEVREFCKEIEVDCGAEVREFTKTMNNVAEVLTTFRGIVRFDDAYAVYAAHEENPLPEEVFAITVSRGAMKGEGGFDLCTLDGEICLVADAISDAAAADNGAIDVLAEGLRLSGDPALVAKLDSLMDSAVEAAIDDVNEYRRLLLKAQEEIGPRPVDDVLGKDPYDFILALPASFEMLAHFDAHVPDDEDDYLFAETMMEPLLQMRQGATNPKDFVDILEEEGVTAFVEDEKEFKRLARNFFNETPSWENAGWSPKELNARKVVPFKKGNKQQGKGKGKSKK